MDTPRMTRIDPVTCCGAMRRYGFAAGVFWLLFGLPQADPAAAAQRSAEAARLEQFVWTPQLAPEGPVLIVVGLREQQAFVYRNGIRIGMSPVSTGKSGYETPTGVFSILQKHREHYSNRYDNAPMPYMQRLTWDGIALHAGRLPGYPASHGCIRLPYAFSAQLFGITAEGMTVVVTASISDKPVTTSPGLFATRELVENADVEVAGQPSDAPWTWRPERSLQGPMNLLLSTQDQQIVVLRNGIEIGWARIEFRDAPVRGTAVYTLLAGTRPLPSPVAVDRPARSWLAIPMSDAPLSASDPIHDAVAAGRLVVPQAFARQVYDALTPGATLVVTDEPIRGRALLVPGTLFEAMKPAATPPSESRR